MKNEEYSRKILPYLKPDYFSADDDKILFNRIHDFILKYNNLPSKDALIIEIDNQRNLKEDQVKAATEAIEEIEKDTTDTNVEWLVDTTEKWCQERAIYLAILTSMDILQDKSGTQTKGAIPQLLSDALAVTFDPNVGHDYLEDFDARFDYYHKVEDRIPFDIEFLNKITGGGLPKKTLNIILAGVNVGKSMIMCHMAAAALAMGKDVLYVTLEMAENEIAKRIDANLMNTEIKDLTVISKEMYTKKANQLKGKTNGRLFVREYPTAGASTIHFKALLNELRIKKSFRPQIIFIDYLNICMSARVKPGGNVNSYTYVKAIAEELRGLAVEYNVPVVSATQLTRSGFASSDVELTDTAESFGLPATADFMFAALRTEELDKLGQIQIKQLKNRYDNAALNKRFVIGVDIAKMKLYDVESSAQTLMDSGQESQVPKGALPSKTDKFKGLKI